MTALYVWKADTSKVQMASLKDVVQGVGNREQILQFFPLGSSAAYHCFKLFGVYELKLRWNLDCSGKANISAEFVHMNGWKN